MTTQSVFLKPLQTIFFALFSGQALVIAVIYFFVATPKSPISDDIFSQIVGLFMLGMVVFGYFVFNMRRQAWEEETNIEDKKIIYRTSSLIKWAMFEGVSLAAIVLYFAMGNQLFLFIALASVIHFALHFPSRVRVTRELSMDSID